MVEELQLINITQEVVAEPPMRVSYMQLGIISIV